MNNTRSLARKRGFGFAAVLVLLGVFGFLWNLQVLPYGFWGEFWRLWPLLLVAVGLNLILSRRRAWIGSVAALAVVASALGAAWALAAASTPTLDASVSRESILVQHDGAQSARLNLNVEGGDLLLTGGAPPGLLLVGESQGSLAEEADPQVQARTSDSRRTVDVRLNADWDFEFPSRQKSSSARWVLRHAGGLPTDIHVEAGTSAFELDLRELNVQSLSVGAGAADIKVVLPANAGRTTAKFTFGVADLDITIPPDVAARIAFHGGASNVDIDTSRFPQQPDGAYVSPGFESAANQVTITLEAGLSDITIR